MLVITTVDGELHINGSLKIPAAEAGVWSPGRHAKLLALIQGYVAAAEYADTELTALQTERDGLGGKKRRARYHVKFWIAD